MKPHSDEKIIDSWHKNAPQWTTAVRGGDIASRELITNAAVIDAILRFAPNSVLDIGCGEGWLIRALAPQVANLVGLDVVPELIGLAQTAGGGEFHILPYDKIAASQINALFDVVVCNFSLLGGESVDSVFGAVASLLAPGGVFIVQTLHPMIACGDLPYKDGWRDGSWSGFSDNFIDPAPWYFRTLESWVQLFTVHGFHLDELLEPVHPKIEKPASVIFIATASTVKD